MRGGRGVEKGREGRVRRETFGSVVAERQRLYVQVHMIIHATWN